MKHRVLLPFREGRIAGYMKLRTMFLSNCGANCIIVVWEKKRCWHYKLAGIKTENRQQGCFLRFDKTTFECTGQIGL